MKLKFDANQQFQIDAVAAITDLFDGQAQGPPEFSVIDTASYGGLLSGQESTELGVGNRLLLAEESVRANAREIQLRNGIEDADPETPLESWRLFDSSAKRERLSPHFSIEMETGTGKTYVYLRTIFELSQRYGFQKFIIVVPSVAIREGVLKNIEITADHFRALFNNLPFEHMVYDSRWINRLRHFATSNSLQILIMNIQAFQSDFTGTEDEKKSNVIYRESDKLSGRQPIEFVQAARPIVVIDEPQSIDSTEKAREAIKALNPLCTLRYSATHRNPYNLMYRLDPITAFELKLVKQIVVASAESQDAANTAFVRVEAIVHKPSIQAKLGIHVQSSDGPRERTVTVKQGDDLFIKSKERANYQDGYEIAEIDATPGSETIRFTSGLTLGIGQETGGIRDDLWRAQIKHTIKQHLEKELLVRDRGIKVLSLFFIDRVANYRDYDNGHSVPGKFATVLEEELARSAEVDRYKNLEWLKAPIELLHDGYFAKDKKGAFKDTGGESKEDVDAYDLIMKDKERLLSMEEPLRFIFSHSALREGWDNPNVFQICTLNETKSSMKKRQEIGRGLRLPVDQTGERVFDESVNRLYVMANESYEDFARALQTEYEEDCGVTFGHISIRTLERLTRVVNQQPQLLGREAAESIKRHLVREGILDEQGRIQPAFTVEDPDFELPMPEEHQDWQTEITDHLSEYRLERHIRRARDEQPNALNDPVYFSSDFKELWDRIKRKTSFSVEFGTEDLIKNSVAVVKKMSKVPKPTILVTMGKVGVERGGVSSDTIAIAQEQVTLDRQPLPDILAYLQNETNLTRSTIFQVLKESGRLDEFFENPQAFMDQVARILRHELQQLLVDGIKYELIEGVGSDTEWEMALFEQEEVVNLLSAMKVEKSIYHYVEFESDVERRFARKLDKREDIVLFVKLPGWFKVDTPVGEYNPDWAIVKHNDDTLYLVKETKGTTNLLDLRPGERDRVLSGKKHFEALGISFEIAKDADEV
jgi:type III restriction enzyme